MNFLKRISKFEPRSESFPFKMLFFEVLCKVEGSLMQGSKLLPRAFTSNKVTTVSSCGRRCSSIIDD